MNAGAATRPCARRWRWRPTTCSTRSPTQVCAAAAVPASAWAKKPASCPAATWTSTWSATPTSPSRARSKIASSCRRARTCSSRASSSRVGDRDPPRLHLHPRRVRPPGRHPRGGDRRSRGRPGYLGTDILGSEHTLKLVLHRGAGAYICGEETGLLDSLEGKRGNPRLKPPFPAIEGLYHGPTLINNVETLATVPHIITHGRGRVRQDRHRDLDRHQARLDLRRRPAPGQLRDRARHPVARDHLRLGRRPHGGPRR